jgi:hypothetical protein
MMSRFERFLAVLAEDPAAADCIAAQCGAPDKVDPARLTEGLLRLAHDKSVAISQAELEQGLARMAPALFRLAQEKGIDIPGAAGQHEEVSDAELDQVTGGLLLPLALGFGAGALIGLALAGLSQLLRGLTRTPEKSPVERLREQEGR